MSWDQAHGSSARWHTSGANRFVRLAVPALLGLDMVPALADVESELENEHFAVIFCARQVSARNQILHSLEYKSDNVQVHNIYLVHKEWRKSLQVKPESTLREITILLVTEDNLIYAANLLTDVSLRTYGGLLHIKTSMNASKPACYPLDAKTPRALCTFRLGRKSSETISCRA